jgi:hypothetical protein
MGMSVAEMEKHLVSRGMSAEDASGLVLETVAQTHAAHASPIGTSEWASPFCMMLSLAMAAACFGIAYRLGGGGSVLFSSIIVLPALGAAWLPNFTVMADYEWGSRWAVCGWIVLVLYFCSRAYWLVMWSLA